jgi:prepilin-type N-terminal cleavage/methylation domain-containing protein
MKNKFTKGFTLIELLVVIAIIGILSSVVLASLNTARGKGANAAVKSNLNNMRAQAELTYDNDNGTYANVCAAVAKAGAAASAAGTPGVGAAWVCNNAVGAWAGSAGLKIGENGNNYWCVDSTGSSKGEPGALGAATVCAP